MMDRVLVNKEYFSVLSEPLIRMGFKPFCAPYSPSLPPEIQYHPDSNLFLRSRTEMWCFEDFVWKERSLFPDITINTIPSPGRKEYPDDAALNILNLNRLILACKKSSSKDVLSSLDENVSVKYVKQGYCSCSVAVLNEKCCITADLGIYRALISEGIQCLLIDQTDILLNGFPNGFIGGCGGNSCDGRYFLTGKLDGIHDGQRVRDFAKSNGIILCELTDLPLFDCGGLIFV